MFLLKADEDIERSSKKPEGVFLSCYACVWGEEEEEEEEEENAPF